MTSIKVKFRPSTVDGKEGGLYFQIIHNRVVRQLNTDYRIFANDWNLTAECIIMNESCSAFCLAGMTQKALQKNVAIVHIGNGETNRVVAK